ncbi:hypothetical protein HMPREF9404_4839 [Eggerthella sp. HGA1]|nr:hypothetical protein HMPREF9404_4839 [Eggerthella sp. HGA1]
MAKIVFIRSYCDFFYQLSDNADCTLFCSVCEPSEAFLCR